MSASCGGVYVLLHLEEAKGPRDIRTVHGAILMLVDERKHLPVPRIVIKGEVGTAKVERQVSAEMKAQMVVWLGQTSISDRTFSSCSSLLQPDSWVAFKIARFARGPSSKCRWSRSAARRYRPGLHTGL